MLTIRILGAELLHISTEKDAADTSPGDVTTTGQHFGFISNDLPIEHRRGE